MISYQLFFPKFIHTVLQTFAQEPLVDLFYYPRLAHTYFNVLLLVCILNINRTISLLVRCRIKTHILKELFQRVF